MQDEIGKLEYEKSVSPHPCSPPFFLLSNLASVAVEWVPDLHTA